MIKLSFKNEKDGKVVENHNNKVVKVTMEACLKGIDYWEDVPSDICKKVSAHSAFYGVPGLNLVMMAQGKAKCSDKDVFDLEKGTRIAEARAKIKLFRFSLWVLGMLIDHYEAMLGGKYAMTEGTRGFLEAHANFSILLGHEKEHLKKLMEDGTDNKGSEELGGKKAENT